MKNKFEPSAEELVNKITSIANDIWDKYRFAPYGNEDQSGRSTLSYQLENPEEKEKYDCKLPTYWFLEKLNEIGLEYIVCVYSEIGTHPYICVRLQPYQDLVLLVSFHPLNVYVSWLTWINGMVVRWGESLQNYLSNNGFIPLPAQTVWVELDKLFLKSRGL